MEKDYKAPVGEGLYLINTGDWRTQFPAIDQEVCTRCGLCLMYCPVNSVRLENGRFTIDLSFCKGCSVCAHECPAKAISMSREVKR